MISVDGLTVEFGNKKVTEHLEDINGFLRKKQLENLKEIERNKR